MKYKELIKKLEKKNPSKAYYIDLSRQNGINLLAIPYFIGITMILIGGFLKFFIFILGLVLIVFGLAFFICSTIALIFNNQIYKKRLEKILKEEK